MHIILKYIQQNHNKILIITTQILDKKINEETAIAFFDKKRNVKLLDI